MRARRRVVGAVRVRRDASISTALGALCRERGVFFVVDAIQGLGPLTLDLRDDARRHSRAAARRSGCCRRGARAFVYVRRGLIEQLEPHDVSWLAVKGSDDFSRLTDYDLTWRDDARRFEFITLPFQDFAGMNASLELFTSSGRRTSSAHTRRLARSDRRLGARSRRRRARDAGRSERIARGSSRFVRATPRAASAALAAAKVAHSLREGAIRLSPHFYNTRAKSTRAGSVIVVLRRRVTRSHAHVPRKPLRSDARSCCRALSREHATEARLPST